MRTEHNRLIVSLRSNPQHGVEIPLTVARELVVHASERATYDNLRLGLLLPRLHIVGDLFRRLTSMGHVLLLRVKRKMGMAAGEVVWENVKLMRAPTDPLKSRECTSLE